MRRTLGAAALACALLGGIAAARTVATGGTVKLTRESRPASKRAYWTRWISGEEVRLIVFPGEVAVGDLYDLVDDQGWIARARVERVSRSTEGCPRYEYITAEARLTTKRAREAWSVGAVGPMRAQEAPVRKFLRGSGSPIEGLPPPGAVAGLQYAVDLDGDGRVDLARYVYDCASGPNSSVQTHADACVEDYSRDGSSWERVDRATFRCQ